MAKMIPELPVKSNSKAEEKIFWMFKNATANGADKWFVFHSFRIAGHLTQMEGEIDFLVLVPGAGVVGIEVKGGRIDIDRQGQYYSVDGNDQRYSIKNPFKQAKDNIESINTILKQRHHALPFYTHGVMFPDCNFQLKDEINEWQWRIFDKRDGENVISYINELIGKTRQRFKDKIGFDAPKPSLEEINALADYLTPGTKEITHKEWVTIIESQQAKFLENQLRYINMFINHKRCLIEGTAGTGKTFIAIEAVKRALANGERVAVICYNSVLGRWLKSQLSYKNEYFFAGSFHEFMLDRIKKAGLKLMMPNGKEYFEELDKISPSSPIKFPVEVADSDDFWEKDVPHKTLEALEKEPIEYDSVFVDEAQDLLLVEYFAIIEKIVKGGISKGKWCLFSDPEQDITKKGEENRFSYEEAIQLILGQPGDSFTRPQPPLMINCRNSVKIGEAISKLKPGKQDFLDNNRDAPGVLFEKWSATDEQKEKLEKLLDKLLRQEHIKPGEITILSAFDPHERLDWYEASVLSKLNKKYSMMEYKRHPETITYSTIPSFKGMENSVVILVDITSYSNTNLLYVGMSRARSVLYVFESEEANKERKQIKTPKGENQ